jgi:serine protease Do
VRAEAKVSVEFADSDKEVQRGDLVLALGNPLGLKHTVTHGIVSAKGRLLDRHSLVDMIQTDAAINPGNSGGPLFDQFGRLVGINVAIASDNGGNQGIAFAIPSNVAKKVFDELVEKGEVVRGYLGVGLAELPHEQAAALGLTRAGGALVTKVEDGEAAGRAGMKVGDVIVAFNKEALAAQHPIRQLRQLISECPVGQDVAVDVLRDGQRQTLQVQLGKRPPNVP